MSFSRGSYKDDHVIVVEGLARVARGAKNRGHGHAIEECRAVVEYLYHRLQDWKVGK